MAVTFSYFLSGVLGCVCVCVRAPLLPRHSWMGCAACVCVFELRIRLCPATPGWGVGACVFVGALRLYPGTPGWGVRCWCVCLGSGLSCAPPSLARVLGCVCVCGPAPLLPRQCWVGCAVWVCVLACGFGLRPATPGRGVGLCLCLWARSACTPPLLAGVCGVRVCASARVRAAPHHPWLGCWGLFVFVGALCFYPATRGWDVRCRCVCLGWGFGCALQLLVGVLGFVCVCGRAPLVCRHSWLGCAVWVCVLGFGFRLCPATPGGVVGVCVCLWAPCSYPVSPDWGVWCGCVCLGLGFRCAPPLLAGVLGCVCVFVGALLVPCHSRLGCAVWVCVRALGFWLRPATSGSVVGACVSVCTLCLYPATPGWGVRCGCVCLGLGLGCAPPLLAGVLGSLSACVRAPLVPRHSWLGCALWVCVLGLRSQLRPATPGWGVGVCVSVCTLCLYPGFPGWGLWCVGWVSPGPLPCAVVHCGLCAVLLLGTCPCALVVAGGVPLWRALWPLLGAPPLIGSGRSQCSGRLSRRDGDFPHPGGLRPRIYLAPPRGKRRPAENEAL